MTWIILDFSFSVFKKYPYQKDAFSLLLQLQIFGQ